MVNVYKWPPVGAISREWTQIAPVSVSRSMITGAEFVTAAQRRRRVAQIEVSAIFSPFEAGAGYMEALKRLLDGGIHLVRLEYYKPGSCHLDVTDGERQGGWVEWVTPPSGFGWIIPPGEFRWFAGVDLPYTVTTDGGLPAIRVTGLPPNALVALPGEFVSVEVDDELLRFMVVAPASSDGAGVVIIRLTAEPPAGDRVSIGARDTGIFKADALPRAVEPSRGDWSYSWQFTEVFEDEGRGALVEIDPWS